MNISFTASSETKENAKDFLELLKEILSVRLDDYLSKEYNVADDR